ncbi:AAC-rich mRNA clone AAC4 protein-like [Diadema antillarum]
MVKCQFDPFRRFQDMNLSEMARRMKECPNAGGDSVESEVMSLELFHRCFGAKLLKTEMEIEYFPHGGSIVDYTCEMFGVSLGVSVTRAMKYKGDFEKEDAEKLLGKKLSGIANATQNALDRWSKKVLHIWATSAKVADTLSSVYNDLSPQLRQDTVVMVTIVTQPQHSLFRNSR